MQGRRYSEGGEVPTLTFPLRTQTIREKLQDGRRNEYIVPTKAKTSGTSDAKKCFVERDFSEKLQQFMLNYSYTLVTTKVLSGEI